MSNYFVYGIHAVTSLLCHRQRVAKKLLVAKEREDARITQLLEQAKALHIPLERPSGKQLDQQFAEANHQGVVAQVDQSLEYVEQDLEHLLAQVKKPSLILILDGVTDPHNLGACLRSADATGVDLVVIPKDKNVGLTATVSKVACGAAEAVSVVKVTNLVRVMERLKAEGIWIYGACGEANTSLYQLDTKDSIAIVLGAEDKGIRRLTREHCDGLFSLPMFGTVSSLNVSVATGVCLYEIIRQRLS